MKLNILPDKRVSALNNALLPHRCAGELRNESYARAIKEVEDAGWISREDAEKAEGEFYVAYRSDNAIEGTQYCIGYCHYGEGWIFSGTNPPQQIPGEILGCFPYLPKFPGFGLRSIEVNVEASDL